MLSSLTISAAQAQAPNLSSVTDIDHVVREQVDSGFSGVVLVARRGIPILQRAYFPKGGPRISVDDWFAIGSMTKGFTAAAIILLQNDHKLAIEDSIGRFFPDAPPDKRGITIIDLLSHRSGLQGRYAGQGITDRDSAVRSILSAPLKAPPGSQYEYIDDDYELLAAIIEVASRKSWQSYVKEKILDKLDMKHTGFEGTDWAHRGAAGMTSTAEDLFRWLTPQRRRQVMGESVARQLDRPLVLVRREPPLDVYYGYGTRLYLDGGNVTEIMHSGSAENGATSIARILLEGHTIIVLSRAGSHGGTTWASYVAQKISPRPHEAGGSNR